MAALAGNLHFFGACVLAPATAVLLARCNIAIAGLVGALMLFLFHVLLLASVRVEPDSKVEWRDPAIRPELAGALQRECPR